MIRTSTPVPGRAASPAGVPVSMSRKPLPRQPPARPPPPPSIQLTERRIGTNMNRSNLEPLVEREANRFITDSRVPHLSEPVGLGRQSPQPHRSSGLPKDQIRAQAMVVAEVRTNVTVTNEYTFITELSTHLSVRYGRPVTSIVVTLQHSICMLFGGSFEPAYTVTVSALPGQMHTTANKRNVALLQAHLFQALRVPPKRGFVRFTPVTDECSGWGGKTVAGQIAEATGVATKVPANATTEAGRGGGFKLRAKTLRPVIPNASPGTRTPAPMASNRGNNVGRESPSGAPSARVESPAAMEVATEKRDKRTLAEVLFGRRRKP